MKKRFLSGLLAAVMTLGLALSAFPAIIANAATAEPISSINLADKFEEGVAKYLDGETQKTWSSWQSIGSLAFGSFKFGLKVQGFDNITRAWADGTTAGVEGKMNWNTDYYVEGGSGMAAISSTGNAIRFEAAYTQTQKATYTVERDGVYNLVADVANIDYSDTNPHQETVKLEVLVNGELADEITLAYGETGTIATEIKTLYVGDTITLQTTSIRDNDEIHWKYKLDVAAELQVFEDLGPDEKWNMHDELQKGLAALVATGTDYKGTAFSALDLGVFDFDASYYKRVWEVAADGFNGGSLDGSVKADDGHYKLKLTGGVVQTHGCYKNATYITFTAPKAGKYTIVPTADLTVSGTGTSFTVSANGTALAIGPNGETDLTATTAGLKPVEVTLAAGDTIVVANKGDSWNTYFSFDFDIEYEEVVVEDLSVIETYNVADSLRTYLATNPTDKTIAFGNYKLDYVFQTNYTSIKTFETTATEYKLIPTDGYDKPYIGVALDAATYAGIKISGTNYAHRDAISFIAPKDGLYTITDAVSYGSKTSLYNNNFTSGMTLQILVNGVAQTISEETDPTVLTVGNGKEAAMPDLGAIALNKGDTVQFLIYMPAPGWNARNAYVNFNVNLVKDLSPVDSWNVRDELSAGLTTLAGDGNDYAGTAIANLDLGDFRLRANYYSNVGSLTATQINNSGCTHGYLKITSTGVQMHQDYKNPFGVKFTAPKAGKYTLVPVAVNGENAVYFQSADANSYFEVTKNGEALAIGPDGETRVSANSALATVTVDLAKGDVIEFAGATNNSYNGYLTFNYNINLMEETPVFASANIALSDDITIKFAVNKSWFTEKGYSDPMVRYELADRVVEVTEYEEATINGTLRYRFALTGVGPQTMADTVKATLIATNAEGKRFAYETREYSVKTYCMNQINSTKTTTEFKAFCVNTLNYGAASQVYVGHNTENLANADLTAEQAALAVPERAEYKDTIETGAKDGIVVWKSANLLFGSSVSMQFKFQTAADMTGCYVEVNGARLDDSFVTYDEAADRYVIKYTDLRPDQFSKRINVVVKDADGNEISPVLGYDMETYVARVKGEDMKELGKKVIAYGDAAEIYAESKN